MFRTTKVSAGLMVAFGGTLLIASAPALAQQSAQSLERVEITGSAIKRVQAEGPAPVEIYTRKDIERTGATSVAELVKNIAAIDIDDQGELTGNSPSGSGASNLQIRGLSERNVLILLNGRRLPVNALQDGSGAGAAVDVNNIPVSAIERIEVLKDGGSAIYGADAVAGVINFITRKNYTGGEIRVGYGVSGQGDAKETPFGIVAGFGDYDSQGFNVLAAVDYFKRDPLMRTDRDITSSADWRRFAGGRGVDGRSSFHPNGNILNAAGTAVVGQVVPCPPGDLKGTTCLFDFSKSVLTSINGADRLSSLVIGSVKLPADIRLFGEAVLSRSEDTFEAQPAPGVYTDQQGRLIRGRFMQIGPRTTERKSTLAQLTAGLEGTFRSYDWDVSLSQGTNKVTNNDRNYVATDLFAAAIANGSIDPTSTTNSTAILDSIRLTPQRAGKSVTRNVAGKISGPITQLSGGPLAFAVGVNLGREELSDKPDANQQAGNVFGSIAQAPVDGSRNSRAVFGELSLPFFKGFEAQVAVRHDQYTDLEAVINGTQQSFKDSSKTSPKFAIKYQPINSFMARASYAESFLAPSLKQLFGGQDQGAESTSDPAICAHFGVAPAQCNNFPYKEQSGSNPNLKPETGKTYNVGFVFEPTNVVGISLDFFEIRKRDEISTPTTESAIEDGSFAFVNGEWVVFVNNQNFAQTRVRGVDLDLRVRIGDTPLGRMSLRNSMTYYHSIANRESSDVPWDEFAGTFLSPRIRNTLTASFEQGPWTNSLGVRFTNHMKDSNQPLGTAANANAREIDSYEEVDIGTQYTGIKNLKLGLTIKNVFDRQPSYSNMGASNQYGSMGFPWIYSPRGRFFSLVANYAFK